VLKSVFWLQAIIISFLTVCCDQWWHVLSICVAALIGFWSMVLVIWFRRPNGFSEKDVSCFCWGYFPFLMIFWVGATFISLWRAVVN
jgi:hypothetical protein